MPSEPLWLEAAEVITLNRRVVALTGEPFNVLDPGLLDSALGKPVNHWAYGGENDALSLAVTLLFGIARNHPFEQGNKRTAFEAAILFLWNNGYRLDYPDTPELASMITDVIEHQLSEAEFELRVSPYLAEWP